MRDGRPMFLSAALAGLLAGFSGCATVSDPTHPGALHEDARGPVGPLIEAAWREHIDAAVRKSLDDVVRIYADDIRYVVGETDLRGLEAVRAMEQQTLATMELIEAEHETQSLAVYGDTAYELGTVVGPIRPAGGEPSTVTFHFMAMWKRGADGTWRMAHFGGAPE